MDGALVPLFHIVNIELAYGRPQSGVLAARVCCQKKAAIVAREVPKIPGLTIVKSRVSLHAMLGSMAMSHGKIGKSRR